MMKLIAYFGFTLASILVQFCLMDFINGNTKLDKTIEKVNKQSKHDIQTVMSKINEKPHGLFYRTERNAGSKLQNTSSLYPNASLVEMTTTELSSTILDWVYDENVSTTEDSILNTEMFATSEFENVTEITLFNKRNTTTKPKLIPKQSPGEDKCHCNILYKTCDINCCCDSDCSITEKKIFLHNCDEKVCQSLNNKNLISTCYPQSDCPNKITTSFLGNLFCISKTNLPDKRLTDIQFDEAAINRYPKWHSSDRQEALYEFKKSVYKYNDPIWLFNNDSIFYADIPMTISNNYCNGKKPIKFLINEEIKCIVKLKDLHMFQVLKYVDEGDVLSPVETSINTTLKTDTSLYKTNWTLFTCDDNECREYNKSRDEPHCTDIDCDNIATTLKYRFYYSQSKITKAVLKLHVQKLSMQLPFITQNIKIKFYLSNESEESIIKLSGNPGYNWDLPVLISGAESNHTLHFFNTTNEIKNILTYPDNKNGLCVLSNVTYKIVQFGHNRRSKCRFHMKRDINFNNGTNACQFIQDHIFHFLGLNSSIYVSPYGNPQNINDQNWIRMQMFDKNYVYGQYMKKSSELICYNLITRIGYVFAYVDMDSGISKNQNKILFVKIEGTEQNITFSVDDVSTVLTIETSFIEASKPEVYEYAGAPQLNLYLPKSFFLPSNKGNRRDDTTHLILFVLCPFIVRLVHNKINVLY